MPVEERRGLGEQPVEVLQHEARGQVAVPRGERVDDTGVLGDAVVEQPAYLARKGRTVA